MNLIEAIVNSTGITKLLGGLRLLLEKCMGSVNDNTLCNELINALEQKINVRTSGYDNNCDDYHMSDASDSPLFLLHAYLYGTEDCEEIIQSISEFIDNCSGLENLEDTNDYIDVSISDIMETVEACETPCQVTDKDLINDHLLLFPKAKQMIEICFIHPILLKCSIDKKLKFQDSNRQKSTDLHRNFVLNIIKWHIWLLMQRKLE